MYESYYGLKEKPFRLKCKPEFLFRGKNFSEILDRLENAVREGKEIRVLSALAGAGKTTLCESLLERLQSEFICKMVTLSPNNPANLLHTILSAFGIDCDGQNEFELIGMGQAFLNRNYLKENRSAVLIVDDAHCLSEEQLGQFVSLIKLFSAERSLLRVILVGKMALIEKIKCAGFALTTEQCANLFELSPLTADETRDFIIQHLRAVGARRDNYFDQRACQAIFKYCRGIPRQINILCHIALEYGAIERAPRINQGMIDDVAKDNGVDKFTLLCDDEQSNQQLWNDLSLATNIAVNQSETHQIRAHDKDEARESASNGVLGQDSSANETTENSLQQVDMPVDSDQEKTKWDFLQPYRSDPIKESETVNRGGMRADDTQQVNDNDSKGKKLTFTYLDSYKEKPKESSCVTQNSDNKAEKAVLDEEPPGKKEFVEDTVAVAPPPVRVPKELPDAGPRTQIRKTGPVIAIAAGIAGVAITLLLFQLLPSGANLTKTPGDYAQFSSGQLADASKNSGANKAAGSKKEELVASESQDRSSGVVSRLTAQNGRKNDENTDLAAKQARRNKRPATADISVFEGSNAESDLADRETAPGVASSDETIPLPLISGRGTAEDVAIARRVNANKDPQEGLANVSNDRIQQLLAHADELYERRLLTTPVGGSALAAYQEVLLVNPNHPEALEGVRNIKQRYIEWAETAEQDGEYANVIHYLDKALSLDPRDGNLSKALQDARRELILRDDMNAESDGFGNSSDKQDLPADAVQQTAGRRQYVPPVYIEDVRHGRALDGNPALIFVNAKIHGPIDKAEVLVSTANGFKPYTMYDDATHGDKIGNDGIYHTTVSVKELRSSTRFYIAAYTQTGGIIYNPPNADRETYRIRSQSVAEKKVDFTSAINRVEGQKNSLSGFSQINSESQ